VPFVFKTAFMKDFFLSRILAFGHAFRGWGYVLRTQRNAWIHAIASTVVVVLGLWLRIPPRDWAVILLAIGMVWASEILNTAIEAVVDLSSPAHHPLGKVGKDVGAAAVLIAAGAALLIGLLVLGPPLAAKLSAFFG